MGRAEALQFVEPVEHHDIVGDLHSEVAVQLLEGVSQEDDQLAPSEAFQQLVRTILNKAYIFPSDESLKRALLFFGNDTETKPANGKTFFSPYTPFFSGIRI